MNVADEGKALGAEFLEAVREVAENARGRGGVGDAVDADVNDGGAGADPFGFHVGGFAHGGDEDITAAHRARQIARLRMANGDRSIGMHEQESHGLADNVAAAEDHGIRAFDRYVAAAENFHTAAPRTSVD